MESAIAQWHLTIADTKYTATAFLEHLKWMNARILGALHPSIMHREVVVRIAM
jgi:hypothetical protein